jgi:hypothetical protein
VCKRTVHGVIYCEDCLANRVNQPGVVPVVPPPVAGAASPGLAAILAFIPGVGAMYNGQFIKGLIHVVVFATLVWAETSVGEAGDGGLAAFVGLLIAFWIFYMVIDAYKTAKARLYGQPLPDPFGIERTFGGPSAAAATAVPPQPIANSAAFVPGQPPVYVPPPPPPPREPSPVGAIVLIGLGVLFLLNTLGLWQFHWMGRMWPLILIGLGVWLFVRRTSRVPSSTQQQ